MTALMHLNSQTASLTMTPERVKLVLKHADSALLLRKPSGQWDLPGGRRDSDEALQATLVREVYEETGMSVTAPVYLGDYLRLRGARPPVLVAFYGATLPKNWSLATLKLSDEHDSAVLLPAYDLASRDMPELYLVMIEHWLSIKP